VISFGSRYKFMNYNDSTDMIEYNDETSLFAQDKIKNFKANYGGTHIYEPLKEVFEKCEK